MFENIKKCLNDFENAVKKDNTLHAQLTKEEKNIIHNFDLHLAEALIRDCGECDCRRTAKIILAKIGE